MSTAIQPRKQTVSTLLSNRVPVQVPHDLPPSNIRGHDDTTLDTTRSHDHHMTVPLSNPSYVESLSRAFT